MNKLFLGLLSTVLISGCSSSALVEEFEEDWSCYRSAKILEGGEDMTGMIDVNSIFSPSNIVLSKVDSKYGSLTPTETEKMKRIADNLNEFYDEIEYSPEGYKDLFHPVKIYNSESCLAMHEHEKIDLPIEFSFLYYLSYIFL